jgi:hypothetical protein
MWSLKSRQPVYHSEIHVSQFSKVKSNPKWHNGLWTFQTMGHGSLGYLWRMDSTKPDVLTSSMCSCSLPLVSLGHTELRSLPHKTVAPSFSSFLLGWLACHSNRTGWRCLRTLQFPGAVSPLWDHNHVFPNWLDCISNPSKDPPPLHSPSTFVMGSWQDLLIWAWLFSSMFPHQLVQGGTGMTFLSCPKELPIWHPQLDERKYCLWWVQKCLNPIVIPSAMKTHFKAISLWEQHLPSPEAIPLCGHKVYQTGNQGFVIPGFSVPNFMKTCKLSGKILKLTTGIHFMSTKKLIHFHPRNTVDHTGDSKWMLSIP